jgi:hypothetical protein
MSGRDGSPNDAVEGQRLMNLGVEHTPEQRREFLVSLWASPATKEKERQLAKELFPKIMPLVEETNKMVVDSIYGPPGPTK